MSIALTRASPDLALTLTPDRHGRPTSARDPLRHAASPAAAGHLAGLQRRSRSAPDLGSFSRRQAFPSTPGLIRSWATGRVQRREMSRETVYCAEVVASTYQQMGLLGSKRPSSWYDPGKFWSGDRIEMVPPFALGPEVAVDVTSG